MNGVEKILYFLQGEMTVPKAFGLFHIFCLTLVIIFIVVLSKNKKNYNERSLKKVLAVYGVIALILEILKQLIWSFNYDININIVTWDYQWYAFPFQLCTTPIFVSLICLFLNKNKFRDYLFSYIAYITILGSISTMLLPDSCFTTDILVNIHTMWLHLGSFVVSIYLLIIGEVKINIKYVLKAIVVFLIFIIIANSMNIIIYNLDILNGETFNMFYISPYFESSLPVFNIIQKSVPYIVYLLIYILALSLGGFLICFICKLLSRLFNKKL